MTVAIVDEQQHCIDRIQAFLMSYHDRVEVVCYDSADKAIEGIQTLRPDIVFLDVQLNDKTGFDVLSSITYRDFCLVFTTTYEQYAIEAFKFSAIDYLLKPIAAEDFENTIQKAFKRVEQNQLSEKINVLLSHLSAKDTPKKISIPSKEGYSFLNIADIVRCEADVNYTHIIMSDKKKYTVPKPLKHFEGLLSNHGFQDTQLAPYQLGLCEILCEKRLRDPSRQHQTGGFS